jgi:hypothetical protein
MGAMTPYMKQVNVYAPAGAFPNQVFHDPVNAAVARCGKKYGKCVTH